MGQENVNADINICVEKVENIENKEGKNFDTQLKDLIGQIKSIREIRMIADSEYDFIQQLSDKLSSKDKEIENLKKDVDKLKESQERSDNLNSQIDELKIDNKRSKECLSLYVWSTIWSVLVVFSFCAIWILIRTPWIEEPIRLIPLLTGGLLVLLIMAVLLILLANKAKSIITHKKES